MKQSTEEIGVTIAEMAASHHDIPVQELPPITNTIDPDALDAIINPELREPPPNLFVSFTYASLRVQIRSGKTVYLTPDSD